MTSLTSPIAFYAVKVEDFSDLTDLNASLQEVCNAKPGLEKEPEKGKVRPCLRTHTHIMLYNHMTCLAN